MGTIHWIGGEKGGVGKSVVARALCQYYIDREIPFSAADADRSHGSLLRSYAEYAQSVDLTDFQSADQIIDRALGAGRRVVIDMPAQSARSLEAWLAESDVLAFAKESGLRLVFWHVSDGGFDSVNLLDELVALTASQEAEGEEPRAEEESEGAVKSGKPVEVVVVKNQGRSTDFSQLEESPAVAALRQSGGHIIKFPALDPATMYKIDRTGSSLWGAIHNAGGEQALSAMERRRAKLWLSKCYQAFDALHPLP